MFCEILQMKLKAFASGLLSALSLRYGLVGSSNMLPPGLMQAGAAHSGQEGAGLNACLP